MRRSSSPPTATDAASSEREGSSSENTAYGEEIFLVESVLGAEKNLWVGIVGS
jgi:hypothetical protein